jgi:hypothetical protein
MGMVSYGFSKLLVCGFAALALQGFVAQLLW